MALDFPLNPTVGALYQTGSSATYEYTNRNYWEVVTPSPLEVISASFATSASYAVTSSIITFTTLASTASFFNYTGSGFEVHVCANTGTDETGSVSRGTLIYPYKTINYALARIGTGSGRRLIIHRGQYAEDVNLTATNMHVVGYNAGNGSLVEINGTVTVGAASSSTRISNIRVNALRHTGAGSAFIDQVTCTVSASFASGYAEVIDSRFECPSGISHTAGTLLVFGSTFSPLTTNNAAATSYLKDCIGVAQPTLTAGTMAIINCQVSAAVSGSPAINTSAGSFLNLVSTNVTTATGVPTKINVGGFLSYTDTVFEKPGSTLGTQVAQTARFQNIDANLISVTGSVSITGSLNVGGVISSSKSIGNTGGEIFLAKPQTNTTIAGTGIIIDSFRDTIRIFEQGGALRGGFYDITQLSGSALTNLYGEQATYLHAKKTGTQTISSNGAPIISGYATPTVSINAGEWNGTTGIFTATKAGTYLVTTQVQYATATYTPGGSALTVRIEKNGVEQNSTNWFSFDAGYVGIPPTIQCNAIVTLVPSNELYVVTFNGSDSSKTVQASGTAITIQELPTRVFR